MHTDIESRKEQIITVKDGTTQGPACEKHSAAGSVSQRACVFCGSRVVLYPIADALHLVHGPIGCAAYTWDIRGALSSGPELHRLSFSTDLREPQVIHGGERHLTKAIDELVDVHQPRAAFIYGTCLAGLIGDDLEAVCKDAEQRHGIPVIPVEAPGFAGTKKTGYQVACTALSRLVGRGDPKGISKYSINILGDFNLAGETWMIADYYRRMGIEVVATITGDGRIDDIARCHGASLNVVQCSGSMTGLAKSMKKDHDVPFIRVSYVGIEDTAQALYDVADFFDDDDLRRKASAVIAEETALVLPKLKFYKEQLRGKTAAVYTGGAFKAISLVRSLRGVGMKVIMAGSQTGGPSDYDNLASMCDEGTIIVDDLGAAELARFLASTPCDLFIGGVKERPLAYKLGVAFCDHNHERKHALAGFAGALGFAEEVYQSACSPVWEVCRRERPSGLNNSSAAKTA